MRGALAPQPAGCVRGAPARESAGCVRAAPARDPGGCAPVREAAELILVIPAPLEDPRARRPPLRASPAGVSQETPPGPRYASPGPRPQLDPPRRRVRLRDLRPGWGCRR